ncbi:MAG: type II secretion system F family protein [Clostridia bacterium]
MPVYRYKASKLDGKIVHGEMQAANRPALREQLQSQKLYLSSCAEQETAAPGGKLDARLLSEFCRELGTMLGAGVPLVRALNIMYKRDISKKAKDVYQKLYRSLKQGSMLSEAMEAQPGVFPELLISMYRASEASGQMEQTSAKMAQHYEKSYRLKKKVRSAMIYPCLLMGVTVVVLLAVFLLILPRFFQLFEDMNAELPGITSFMLNLSKGLQSNWLVLLIAVLVLVLVLRLVLRIPKVRLARDRIRLKIPMVGKLLKIIYTARFARTLSSCYASGISIISALRNARDTIGNDYISSQFTELISDVRNGKSLSDAIGCVDGFDSKLAASIMIGEETGKLYEMLESTADAFDYDADIALSQLVAILEPVMIVIMAVIIGLVIISVMLPLTTLYNAIGMSA